MQQYIVKQVVLKTKLLGGSTKNLPELEQVINEQAQKGYRLHSITTASANGDGAVRDGKIQAIMVFEKL